MKIGTYLFAAAMAGISCIPSWCATDDPAVAVVSGIEIRQSELTAAAAGQIQQLRKQEYDLQRKTLDQLIETKLIEGEATRRGITADQLFKQEISSNIPEPTDREAEAYYLGQTGGRTGSQPFASVKEAVRSALRSAIESQRRTDLMRHLKEEAKVVILIEPARVNVSYDPSRVKGSSDAPVTIVEFSDFQCPYCQRASLSLGPLLEKYKGKVRLAFRDFPLEELHPQAEVAALASRCAAEQGKFWEYHDMLFVNQTQLSAPDLKKYASTAALDQAKFDSCLDGRKYASQIDADVTAGRTAGVAGTPSFFINGVFLTGAQPNSAFEELIDQELARKSTARQ